MAPALSFNSTDGSLQVEGCPLVITSGLSKDRAATSLSEYLRTSIDYKNGYEWLAFQHVNLGGQPCGFALGFHFGKLIEIHWGVSLPNAKLENGWPTREAIDEEIEFNRSVLKKAFGRSFISGKEQFSWGSVWCLFDPKGFQASAGLRYEV